MNKLPIEPNNLAIEAISPSLGARFSPNLYAFLKSRRQGALTLFGRVFRDEAGEQWLGYCDEGSFIGAKLMTVLCYGVKTKTFSYACKADGLIEVEGFWSDYQRHGRCAVDPEHKLHFVGDDTRWTVRGAERECLWCGRATQTMRRWTETVERSAWT